ncbi:hypothetical protein BS78_02G144100 [Paspalum vaginatum]|nr:hypothetical protein BS78_02G144100 [Paspalum vaginatum]
MACCSSAPIKGPSIIALRCRHGAGAEAAPEREAAEGAEGAEGKALHHPPMRRHAALLE